MKIKRILYAALFLIVAVSASAQQRKPDDHPTGSAAANQTATAPASQVPSTALPIRGRVVEEGGRPLADASIMVFPANPMGNTSRTISSMLRPVSSDKNGQFEIDDLSAGAYTLTVFAMGYIAVDSGEMKYYRPGDTPTISMLKGGVITGRVTSSTGEKVVGVGVRAIRIRDSKGRAVRVGTNASISTPGFPFSFMNDWQTDDRGVYRIYGLEPGIYHVAAGGKGLLRFSFGGYDGDAPTYFPSSTYDTASEVIVRAGEEVSNIDIRYRGDGGHAISGTVSGQVPSGLAVTTIQLARASSSNAEMSAIVLPGEASRSFSFDAVPDGDYYLTAIAMPTGSPSAFLDSSTSKPRRVTVKGADVTGVELVLAALGSISGRVVVEPSRQTLAPADCKNWQAAPLKGKSLPFEEIIILARPDERDARREGTTSLFSQSSVSTPDDKGEFVIHMLEAGLRWLELELPGERWYISAITQLAPTSKGKPLDVARDGVTLKSGEQVKGVTISLSEAAASLKGRVVSSQEGKSLPARLRVHLVPTEKESADDVLRYFEVEAEADGSFELKHIAPSRYWLVPRPVSGDETYESALRRVAWEKSGRTGLRFEGEAINTVIELKPCQKVADYALRYTPPIAPTAPTKKKGS